MTHWTSVLQVEPPPQTHAVKAVSTLGHARLVHAQLAEANGARVMHAALVVVAGVVFIEEGELS